MRAWVALVATLAWSCGDGASSDSETDAGTFDASKRCGNGVCKGSETCATCPQDCGACPEPTTSSGSGGNGGSGGADPMPSDLLTWKPPSMTVPDWNPMVVSIADETPGPSTLCGSPTQDLIVDIQGRKLRRLWIEGYRHVEVIGGEIYMDGDNGGGASGSGYGNTGIILRRRNGITHLEGLLVHGPWLGDGIHATPFSNNSIIQVQNCRFDGMRVTNSLGQHPDLFQSDGAYSGGIVRQDKITYRTNYKGDEIQTNLLGSTVARCDGQGSWGAARLKITSYHKKRINGYVKYGTTTNAGGIAASGGCSAFCLQGPWQPINNYAVASEGYQVPLTLEDVWITDAPDDPLPSFPFGIAALPGVGQYGQYGGYYTDGSQTEIAWPTVTKITGTLKRGVPPGGDFVPAASVGENYVSPGYEP